MNDPQFVASKLKIKASPPLPEEVHAELQQAKEAKSLASLISERGVFRAGDSDT